MPFQLLFLLLLQIRFASVDMELHTTYDPSGSLSIYDVDRRVAERTQVLAPLPEDRFLCSFSHIFAGLHHCICICHIQLVEFITERSLISFMNNCRWLCCWILQLQGRLLLLLWMPFCLNIIFLESMVTLISCHVLDSVGWSPVSWCILSFWRCWFG